MQALFCLKVTPPNSISFIAKTCIREENVYNSVIWNNNCNWNNIWTSNIKRMKLKHMDTYMM